MCSAYLATIVVLTLLAAGLAAWLAWRGPPPRRHDGFLDFSRVPHLVFYRGVDSAASRRFEPEWERLKRSVTAAGLNASLDARDVLQPATRAVPSLELVSAGAAAATAYTGPLTHDAVLAWLRERSPCVTGWP